MSPDPAALRICTALPREFDFVVFLTTGSAKN
jgi:hypothetical protein